MKSITLISLQIILCFCSFGQIQRNRIGLQFEKIPSRWDEGLPLGNGLIGELIWQKEDKLRFSLHHAELWDMRLCRNCPPPALIISG